jgi:hypothetical protein
MSTPIKLKLNSSNELKMSLKSYGDINSITEVSLVVESKNFDYKFNGKIIDETVIVNIPKLQGLIESGDYVATLNVIADNDKFFKPYVGSVSFGEVGKVNVAETTVTNVNSNIEVEVIHEADADESAICVSEYDGVKDDVEEPTGKSKLPSSTSFSEYFDKTK